jgi:hypothetical protein
MTQSEIGNMFSPTPTIKRELLHISGERALNVLHSAIDLAEPEVVVPEQRGTFCVDLTASPQDCKVTPQGSPSSDMKMWFHNDYKFINHVANFRGELQEAQDSSI